MKKAFTLIEMLVVVGIIAVLASIVLVNIRGATDAANATKCMSNLRSLFNAANSIALSNKFYPLAGPCIRKGYDDKTAEITKGVVNAWIGCNSSGNVMSCYDSTDPVESRYALEHGAGDFLDTLGGNDSVYNCPIFVKDHLVKRKCKPLFSYAMNAGNPGDPKRDPKACGFGSDKEVGYQGMDEKTGGIVKYGTYSRADKMVMFAELPIKQSCNYDPLANPDTCNCALQFNKKIGGVQYGNPDWKGRSESIGFVHQDKRKKYFGHVVFTDGHVEKFMQPPASSSLKEDVLTAHICAGDDVAYDDSGYRLVAEVEDEEE